MFRLCNWVKLVIGHSCLYFLILKKVTAQSFTNLKPGSPDAEFRVQSLLFKNVQTTPFPNPVYHNAISSSSSCFTKLLELFAEQLDEHKICQNSIFIQENIPNDLPKQLVGLLVFWYHVLDLRIFELGDLYSKFFISRCLIWGVSLVFLAYLSSLCFMPIFNNVNDAKLAISQKNKMHHYKIN